MLRATLTAICLGASSLCFAHELPAPLNAIEWGEDRLVYVYTGVGCGYLLTEQPQEGLKHLLTAESLIDPSDEEAPVYRFFVSFGQIVAYDCLGQRDLCLQALGKMFLTLHDEESEDDDEDEDGDSVPEAAAFVETFRKLAQLAPSPDVKAVLLSVVDDMAQELLD